jgi:ABC-type cobalamin/Fe3+-siderophores transport systems, ATPase components
MGLEIRNLCYRYASNFSLTDISLCFDKGITAVIGPNGAGKSTMVKCIANIYAFSGQLYYNKEKIDKENRRFFSEKVSYLPQSSQSDATITVFEAVLLGLISSLTFHVGAAQIDAVNGMLRTFELGDLANRKIYELSGGQLQMVLLAQAIIKAPEILILDEPLNNLDIHRQFSLLNRLKEFSADRGMVTVIVMHDINLAARYADSVALLYDGRVLSQGEPETVITKQMLKQAYKLESIIHKSRYGYPVAEFVDIAIN